MTQDTIRVEQNHKKFVKQAAKSGSVYGLENKDGFATAASLHYEDDNEKPIEIICFWSERELTKPCITGDWEGYKVAQISLTDFIENWCIGMDQDRLLVGTEFDHNKFGFEAEPLDLILELLTELKSINKDLKFKKFKGISDLEEQLREILE